MTAIKISSSFDNSDRAKRILGILYDSQLLSLFFFFFFTLRKSIKTLLLYPQQLSQEHYQNKPPASSPIPCQYVSKLDSAYIFFEQIHPTVHVQGQWLGHLAFTYRLTVYNLACNEGFGRGGTLISTSANTHHPCRSIPPHVPRIPTTVGTSNTSITTLRWGIRQAFGRHILRDPALTRVVLQGILAAEDNEDDDDTDEFDSAGGGDGGGNWAAAVFCGLWVAGVSRIIRGRFSPTADYLIDPRLHRLDSLNRAAKRPRLGDFWQRGTDMPEHIETYSLNSGLREADEEDWFPERDSSSEGDSDSDSNNSENELLLVGDQVSWADDNYIPAWKQSGSQGSVYQALHTSVGSVLGSPGSQLAFTLEMSREAKVTFFPKDIPAIPHKSLKSSVALEAENPLPNYLLAAENKSINQCIDARNSDIEDEWGVYGIAGVSKLSGDMLEYFNYEGSARGSYNKHGHVGLLARIHHHLDKLELTNDEILAGRESGRGSPVQYVHKLCSRAKNQFQIYKLASFPIVINSSVLQTQMKQIAIFMEQIYLIYFGNYSGTPDTQAILNRSRAEEMPVVQGIGANRQLPMYEGMLAGGVDMISSRVLHSLVNSYFKPVLRERKWALHARSPNHFREGTLSTHRRHFRTKAYAIEDPTPTKPYVFEFYDTNKAWQDQKDKRTNDASVQLIDTGQIHIQAADPLVQFRGEQTAYIPVFVPGKASKDHRVKIRRLNATTASKSAVDAMGNGLVAPA
ncbi:hypothetical protein G7Y89_g10562 [Cudoniella acicularis]|uniref:Uncharacterized protein n=1 Tax=Cudoniella acicularis TaxID=354080 RepID=A0A8H4REU7_9HELO|nr:hypothetical protein G7Y89_g10562 [Cudoniella acicularis]